MSDNATLNSEESKIVRELQQAVQAFGATSVFTPKGLGNAVGAVAAKLAELASVFPEVAKEAAEYYNADFADDPAEKDGYGDALFNTFVSLYAFYDAESFSRVVSAYDSLVNDVYDLGTFSDEYNVDRGCWNSELV
jgi:hypothetical protein